MQTGIFRRLKRQQQLNTNDLQHPVALEFRRLVLEIVGGVVLLKMESCFCKTSRLALRNFS